MLRGFRKAIVASILMLSSFCDIFSLVDFDEMTQEFVLESRQIDVPGYPNAFNASIIRWNGSLLMSFRDIADPKQSFNSRLGVIWLDEEFHPVGPPQLLDTQHEDPFPVCTIPSRAEDVRLLTVGDSLYIVYSDNKDAVITGGGFRVYIAELLYDGIKFTVHQNECIREFPGMNPKKREKNWVPFDYKGNLMLAYSLLPHYVFKSIRGTGKCESVAWSRKEITWDWGDLRGGTPALLMDGEYFSIFHTMKKMSSVQSNGKEVAHYFMGAYTFSAEPPFDITTISPEPIFGNGFYSGREYKPYWGSIKAIFPCGFISDENYIWITYGKQDHEIWIVKIDKNALFKSLVPVTTKNHPLQH